MSGQYKNHFAFTLRITGNQLVIINEHQLPQIRQSETDWLTDLTLTDDVETDEESHHRAQHGGDAEDEDALGQGPVEDPVALQHGQVGRAGVVHRGSCSDLRTEIWDVRSHWDERELTDCETLIANGCLSLRTFSANILTVPG